MLASTSKKRNFEDIFSDAVDPSQSELVEPPKKKRTSRFVKEEEEESKNTDENDKNPQEIQRLLEETKKQIEERKKQTEALLAKQGLSVPKVVQPPSHQPVVTPSLLPTPTPPLLPIPPSMGQKSSVHPLAYSRELHMARGLGMGPSALDKAIKAAEVRIILLLCT